VVCVCAVVEYNVEVDTSVGPITGVLWDDGELGIGSPLIAEYEQHDVEGPDGLAEALQSVGLPEGEAKTLAVTLWNDALQAYARAAPRPPGLYVLLRKLVPGALKRRAR